MTAYVCGFAFDTERRVYLILKNKPHWQAGLLNGIGGKIEPGETSLRAMAREFKEEAGVDIAPSRWKLVHRESWMNGNTVDFYSVALLPGENPDSMTSEAVMPIDWDSLPHRTLPRHYPMMYNLPYLIPMAYVLLYANADMLPFHATH
jgi:8-oxo-dGTP pyrophosphatase MutT (NUDIX family)